MENTIRNLLSRTVTAVGGVTALLVTPAGNKGRRGVEVFNSSDVYAVVLRAVAAGASPPTLTTREHGQHLLGPGGSLFLAYGSGIDLYALALSQSAATATVVVTEVD